MCFLANASKNSVIRVPIYTERRLAPSKFLSEHLEPRGSTPTEAPSIDSEVPVDLASFYVATYPYHSEETGDLNFEVGDVIFVVSKETEWWTGRIGERSGLFPYNYVEPVVGEVGRDEHHSRIRPSH